MRYNKGLLFPADTDPSLFEVEKFYLEYLLLKYNHNLVRIASILSVEYVELMALIIRFELRDVAFAKEAK